MNNLALKNQSTYPADIISLPVPTVDLGRDDIQDPSGIYLSHCTTTCSGELGEIALYDPETGYLPNYGDTAVAKKISYFSNLQHLKLTTVDRSTRELIFEYYPCAKYDTILFRYIIYVLFGTFLEVENNMYLPMISQQVLEWIAGKPLHQVGYGKGVIERIRCRVPDFEYIDYIAGERPRVISNDGISIDLKKYVWKELRSPASEIEDRVNLIDGNQVRASDATALRNEIREELAETIHTAPSPTSLYIRERMNDRPSNGFARVVRKHSSEAMRVANTMDIDINCRTNGCDPIESERNQRNYYRRVIRAIEDQPQPFYKFTDNGRTDRIYPYNKSMLSLPSEIRDVYSQDWVKLDLRSAHLVIAASLWSVDEVLERLRDPSYSVWDELFDYFGYSHLKPSDSLYKKIKGALKESLYSTVYGMQASSIQGNFTRNIQDVLGASAGKKLREHPMIAALLQARDRELEKIERRGFALSADGSKIHLIPEKDVDAKSVMSTVAQSYEQAIMKVILEYEEQHYAEQAVEGEKPDFRVMLWIHDGVAINFTRRQKMHVEELQRLVRERGKEFGMPIYLELD